MLISDKMEFKTKNVTRYKKDYFVLLKVSIHYEDITIIITCVPDNRASKDLKQKLTALKGEIDNSIIIAENVNSALLVMDGTTRQ